MDQIRSAWGNDVLAEFGFEAAATVLLALHLVCMNIAMVGPLACIFLDVRCRRQDDATAGQLGGWLAGHCSLALLAGLGLGLVLAVLYWWQGGHSFFMALASIPASRVNWGIVELVFYFVCMIPYAVMWGRVPRRWCWFHWLLAVAAATNLMYHFPTLFAVIGKLSAMPFAAIPPLDKAAFRQLMVDGEVLAHVAHHLVAAVAIVGAVVMVRARKFAAERAANESDPSARPAATLVRLGASIALTATLLQIPAGLWLLLESPTPQRDVLLGGHWTGTALFMAALTVAFAVLHNLAVVAMGSIGRRQVLLSAGLLLLVVVLMSGALRQTRRGAQLSVLDSAAVAPGRGRSRGGSSLRD